MNDRVSSIRNLGPKMEVAFNAIGIYDAQTIRALGADESYQRLLNNGFSPHFIGYYALVICFGHGVAKLPQERLHCSRKTNASHAL